MYGYLAAPPRYVGGVGVRCSFLRSAPTKRPRCGSFLLRPFMQQVSTVSWHYPYTLIRYPARPSYDFGCSCSTLSV